MGLAAGFDRGKRLAIARAYLGGSNPWFIVANGANILPFSAIATVGMVMKGFAAWLHNLVSIDPNVAALKAFASTNGATWPYWSDDPADYLAAIRNAPNIANRDLLIDTLSKYFVHWRGVQAAGGLSGGKKVLIVTGVLFVLLMAGGLFATNFYSSLAHTEQVRGLITFLFVLVATSIILVFALGIFWIDNTDDVAKRFTAAKDLLTIVVGIVGTIMGFYFGTATGDGTNLAIASVLLSPPVIHAGENATISGHINGGTKPYKYTVSFVDPDPSGALPADDLNKMKVAVDGSKDGVISNAIAAPAKVDKPKILFYTLTVTDAKSTMSVSNGAIYLEPAKAVAAAPTPAAKQTPAVPPQPEKQPGE
jgi:hypothetical protein